MLSFRENLIEYYSHLSVEAAARERRALWLAQRRELHVKRRQFLDDEEKILTEELEQLAFPENVIIEEPIIAEVNVNLQPLEVVSRDRKPQLPSG